MLYLKLTIQKIEVVYKPPKFVSSKLYEKNVVTYEMLILNYQPQLVFF